MKQQPVEVLSNSNQAPKGLIEIGANYAKDPTPKNKTKLLDAIANFKKECIQQLKTPVASKVITAPVNKATLSTTTYQNKTNNSKLNAANENDERGNDKEKNETKKGKKKKDEKNDPMNKYNTHWLIGGTGVYVKGRIKQLVEALRNKNTTNKNAASADNTNTTTNSEKNAELNQTNTAIPTETQSFSPSPKLNFGKADEKEEAEEAHQNLYEVLGVEENANSEEILDAYIRKLIKCNSDQTEAYDKAFEVLMDPEKRNRYDSELSNLNEAVSSLKNHF